MSIIHFAKVFLPIFPSLLSSSGPVIHVYIQSALQTFFEDEDVFTVLPSVADLV